MANIRDLAVGEILTAPSPATTGTSFVLQAGEGDDMPTTTPYHLLVFPAGAIPTKYNSEKVLVTARSSDTLTVTRAQGETTAKTITAGWLVANALFADDLTGGTAKRNQTPTGLINGSNTSYTVNDIYAAGTLEVYLNGQRLRPGASDDYVETSGGFTMNYAPATGDVLSADYLVTSTAGVTTTTSFVTGETPVGTINGTNLAFTTNSPFSPNSLEVYLNGVRLTKNEDYTENGPGGAFTFAAGLAPPTGSFLRVNYMISGAYLISGSNSLVTGEVPSGTKDGSNALFTVLSASYVANSLEVKLNGVDLQRAVDFVETSPSAGTFTMQTGYIPASTDIVTVSYQLSITTTGNADTVDGFHASATATANTLLPLNGSGVYPQSALSTTTLGYTQITSNFSTASTTVVQVTGLTATVTIPAGGRRVKVTAYIPQVYPTGGYTDILVSLWDGTVGSGTQLQEARSAIASGNAMAQMTVMACPVPAAGSKTYNVGVKAVAATANLVATATTPSFILVELM